jgi:hypothetical protein
MMTEDAKKQAAIDIVNACRKGDSVEKIATSKIMPILDILLSQNESKPEVKSKKSS